MTYIRSGYSKSSVENKLTTPLQNAVNNQKTSSTTQNTTSMQNEPYQIRD